MPVHISLLRLQGITRAAARTANDSVVDYDGAPVDFIYGRAGEEGYGLAHIYEKHGRKVLAHIPKIIMNGSSVESGNSLTWSNGSESVVLKKEWKWHEKRWVVTAFEKKNKSPSGPGQSIGATENLTVERADPLYSLNEGSIENLSQNLAGVNELNCIQRFPYEPVMPRGDEVSDVKVGDVKRLISEALDVPGMRRRGCSDLFPTIRQMAVRTILSILRAAMI